MREEISEIRDQLLPFVEKAKRLVIRESSISIRPPVPSRVADPEINCLRLELFGPAMSHGGHFKRLIDFRPPSISV